jgi:uncharacterized MnhB-related membrane protein
VSVAALFDGVLVVALVGTAWRLLASSDLFRSVVLFIVFGLLSAVAWARLGATDLALAEAAIGAGVTGALFLGAIDALERERPGGHAAGGAIAGGETDGQESDGPDEGRDASRT